MCVSVYAYVSEYLVCAHVYMYICLCICVYVYAYVHMYICICVCVYVYLCIHMCICISVYVQVADDDPLQMCSNHTTSNLQNINCETTEDIVIVTPIKKTK